MNYLDEENALQTMLNHVHGDGTYTVSVSVDGGYEVFGSKGDLIENFKSALEVEVLLS